MDEVLKWLMAVGLGIIMISAIFTLIVLIAVAVFVARRWRRIRRIERSVNAYVLGASQYLTFQDTLTKAEVTQIREHIKRVEEQKALKNDKTENVSDL